MIKTHTEVLNHRSDSRLWNCRHKSYINETGLIDYPVSCVLFWVGMTNSVKPDDAAA